MQPPIAAGFLSLAYFHSPLRGHTAEYDEGFDETLQDLVDFVLLRAHVYSFAIVDLSYDVDARNTPFPLPIHCVIPKLW